VNPDFPFPFGFYKGYAIRKIPFHFLHWLVEKGHPKLKRELKEYIKRFLSERDSRA